MNFNGVQLLNDGSFAEVGGQIHFGDLKQEEVRSAFLKLPPKHFFAFSTFVGLNQMDGRRRGTFAVGGTFDSRNNLH